MSTADKNIPWQQSVTGRFLGVLPLSMNSWPLIQPHISAIVEAVGQTTPGDLRVLRCSESVIMPGS